MNNFSNTNTDNLDSGTRGKQLLSFSLQLLRFENIIEYELRSRMRRTFGITLPQFDILAKLDYMDKPISMTALSKQLMVTNGYVTGLVDRLVKEKYIDRIPPEHDKRVYLITLTEKGKKNLSRNGDAI